VNGRIFLHALALVLLFAQASLATEWDTTLYSHPRLPSKFLAVDKAAQEFSILTQKSPLKSVRDIPCTTGQRLGDKLVQGDKKTPEGVYFVQRHLQGGLNYTLYGDQAFTLDFPNPIDRIKGKTGYGIWLHGRGKPLVPRDTQGCVALTAADLNSIETEVSPGLPVVITHSMEIGEKPASGEYASDFDALALAVENWAQRWETRSGSFFDCYDPVKFSLSDSVSFEAFKAHKERLFHRYDWIQVLVDDIRVLPGPDYYVTYFTQYYRAPNYVTQGIKRLYWQKDASGEFRIVGRGWENSPVTLDALYLERSQAEIAPVLDAWRKAWLAQDLDGYASFYQKKAKQDGRIGRYAILDHKRNLWKRSAPQRVGLEKVHYRIASDGIEVSFIQNYEARNGYADRGKKKLVFIPDRDGWKILRETWSRI